MTIWYEPCLSVSSSLRPQSFVNVGSPAVRIQFWKCSSSLRFGRLLLLYPSGKRFAQFGGGVICEASYPGLLAYFFASPGQAMFFSDQV